jgi:hypothetical protein
MPPARRCCFCGTSGAALTLSPRMMEQLGLKLGAKYFACLECVVPEDGAIEDTVKVNQRGQKRLRPDVDLPAGLELRGSSAAVSDHSYGLGANIKEDNENVPILEVGNSLMVTGDSGGDEIMVAKEEIVGDGDSDEDEEVPSYVKECGKYEEEAEDGEEDGEEDEEEDKEYICGSQHSQEFSEFSESCSQPSPKTGRGRYHVSNPMEYRRGPLHRLRSLPHPDRHPDPAGRLPGARVRGRRPAE